MVSRTRSHTAHSFLIEVRAQFESGTVLIDNIESSLLLGGTVALMTAIILYVMK